MMNFQNLILIAVTLLWIGCSSKSTISQSSSSLNPKSSLEILAVNTAPDIPFSREDAFYPLRMRQDGKILASYQWRECIKRFIVCTKWEMKTIYFEDLSWFYANGFGLSKRKRPEL